MNEADKKRYLPALKRIIVFRYLADDALAEVADACEIVPCVEGDRVVAEGELDAHLYAVLEGSVNVLVGARGDKSKQVFICALGEGDVFGEAGIFLQTPRTADVVAASQATVLRVDRDKLFAFIQKHPSAGIKMLYIIIYSLLRKLRDANQELAFERKGVMQQDDIDSIVEAALKKI